MSTSSPPRTPATGLIPVDWRRPRRLWVRVGVVLLAAVVAVVAWQVVRDDEGPGLAGRATVTVSSSRMGFDAHAVVDSGDARAPRAEWHSDGDTVGAWLELSWPQRHDLQQVVLVRNPVAEPGVTAGFLSFGDGSQLQVTLSSTSPATTIPFTARSVDKLRFTASAVADGARDVRIAEVLVATSSDDAVADGDAPGGNVAVDAAISGTGDPRALHDGVDGGTGAGWTVDPPAGASASLTWGRPEEIAGVEIVGATGSAATVRSATLTFGDGTRLPVGAVLADPRRPTVLGFMPRVTRSLQLTVDRVDGAGPLTIGELRVYRRGATPARTPAPVPPPAPAEAGTCPDITAPTGKLVISCPVTGSAVEGIVPFRVSAPGFSAVTATVWPADPDRPTGPPTQAAPDRAGNAELAVDLGGLPPGPVTVRFEASGGSTASATANFQLYRRGPGGGDVASSPAATGRTLLYAEEFDRPISLTRSGAGADYAAAKPEHDGAKDFGEAVFADPAKGVDTVRVVDDRYLRIDVEPTPYGDPQGWGRTHLGGMLASARPGGSGISAQYGYFEARMLLPAASGTWPAFWMLPSDNLVAPTPVVAEIDALEHYGHNPTGTCHTTHDYNSPHDDGVARCANRFPSERDALSWHTYGVSVLPTEIVFYIDGRVVATAPQVDGGGAPLFFMVNLALGSGWPIDLGAVQDRASLYVDYVRVYV